MVIGVSALLNNQGFIDWASGMAAKVISTPILVIKTHLLRAMNLLPGAVIGFVLILLFLSTKKIRDYLLPYSIQLIAMIAVAGIVSLTVTSSIEAREFAREGIGTNQNLGEVIKITTADDKIIIVGDPVQEELMYSTLYYLQYNHGNKYIYYLPAKHFSNTELTISKYVEENSINKLTDKRQIKAIFVLPGLNDSFLSLAKDWFVAGDYEKITGLNDYIGYFKKN